MLRSKETSPEFKELIAAFSDSIGAKNTPPERFRKVDLFTRYLLDPTALACNNKEELMTHLRKFVMQSPSYGFDRVLAATNASVSEVGDATVLTIGRKTFSRPEDNLGSAKKLFEVAVCAAIRNSGGPDYLVSFDMDAREAEIIALDPFEIEDQTPGSSYERYRELLAESNADQAEEVKYEHMHVDDLRDDDGAITLPDHPSISLEGVDKEDMKPLAAMAEREEKLIRVVTKGRRFTSQKLIQALAPVPYHMDGLDILINRPTNKKLGGLVPGPEDERALGTLVDELILLVDTHVFTFDVSELKKIDKADHAPRGASFHQADAPKTSEYEKPKKTPPRGPKGNLSRRDCGRLKILVEAGQYGSPGALKSLGLAPKYLDLDEKTAIYGNLLNSDNKIPNAMKADLKRVVDDYFDEHCSYQDIVPLLAAAAENACGRINQLTIRPDPMAVALLYFGRSPGVFGYGTGFTEDGEGGLWPRSRNFNRKN